MDENKFIYISRKCKLKKIVKRKFWYKIEDAVDRTQCIIKNTFQFIKYYYTKKYDIEQDPNIIIEPNDNVVSICLNLISNGVSNIRTERVNNDEEKEKKRKNNRKNKLNLKDELTEYYQEYSKLFNINFEGIDKNLSHVLKYAKDQIVTSYLNNITMHFPKYIKKITYYECKKIYFNYKNWNDDYKLSKEEKKEMHSEINKVKTDIFNYNIRTTYKSNPIFYEWLNNSYGTYYPKPLKQSEHLHADLFNVETHYLGFMIKLNILLEEHEIKLYNPLCLRNSNIPKYIKIDKNALVEILVDKTVLTDLRDYFNSNKLVKGDFYKAFTEIQKICQDLYVNNSFDFDTELWKFFCKFDSNKHSRKLLEYNNYVFNHTIMTDGFGASILLIRKDRKGFNCKANKKRKKKKTEIVDCKYLDDLEPNTLQYIKNSTNTIVIDPGKKNILYLSDGQKNGKHLRYTYQQRRKETKFKEIKKKQIDMKIKNNIVEIENNITYNSKSCKLDQVIKYIKENIEFNQKVKEFYTNIEHRQMRYKVQKHTQISEEKLINNIKNKFETDKPVTLIYGNWSCKKQLRGFAPTPGIGLRRKLARKFNVYLLDEFRTSCKCSSCHQDTENTEPREYTKNNEKITTKIHSLLRCQNENCGKLWNRDVNATVNQYHLTQCILNGIERPTALSRNQ